jgi:REase associating with pPIWI_RE
MKGIEELIELVEWVKRLENNIEDAVHSSSEDTVASREFEIFFNRFLYFMLQFDLKEYPVNLFHWLKLLKKPLKDWWPAAANLLDEEGISSDFIILDDEIGLSEEAEELLREYKSYQEASAKVVRDVLIHCREVSLEKGLDMQWVYTKFRLFLIKNPITNIEAMELYCLENDFDHFLSSSLENCYEDIPPSSAFKCQSCGWTLHEKTKNVFVCIKQQCLRSYDVSSLNHYEITEADQLRVKESIQFSTVIPGQRELELKRKLVKSGAAIELYPDLERLGDLRVRRAGEKAGSEELLIDVKDYRNAKQLAKKLVTDHAAGLVKTPVIAVPDDKANSRYLKFVNKRLVEMGINSCKVYSFKQVVRMFKELSSDGRQLFEVKENIHVY